MRVHGWGEKERGLVDLNTHWMCSVPDQDDLTTVPDWQRVMDVEGPVGDEGGYPGFKPSVNM